MSDMRHPVDAGGGLTVEGMVQQAPYPDELADLVARCKYRPKWTVRLEEDLDRGQGSRGPTLVITTRGFDSYHPERGESYGVNHYFPVPPASFDRRSWQWWLFQQFLLVEQHECMEFFKIRSDDCAAEDECADCGHMATLHDGRDSSCHPRDGSDCDAGEHRFSPVKPRYVRPYAPMHGPGNDPYLITVERTARDRMMRFTGEVPGES